jgi:hypothetical protein
LIFKIKQNMFHISSRAESYGLIDSIIDDDFAVNGYPFHTFNKSEVYEINNARLKAMHSIMNPTHFHFDKTDNEKWYYNKISINFRYFRGLPFVWLLTADSTEK